MSAGVTDLIVEQGATFEQLANWLDENDQQINTAGMTARMQVRKTLTSPTTIAELTTENGGIDLAMVVGPPAYNIRIFLTAAQTAALPASPSNKNWYYDLEIVNGSVVKRVLKGRFRVSLEVTR